MGENFIHRPRPKENGKENGMTDTKFDKRDLQCARLDRVAKVFAAAGTPAHKPSSGQLPSRNYWWQSDIPIETKQRFWLEWHAVL